MSRKRSNPLDDPVIDSSGEEDDVDSHESSSEEDNHKKIQVVTIPGSRTKVSKSSVKSIVKRSSSKIDGAAASADVKKVKRVSRKEDEKKKNGGGEKTKKTYFQRVWKEEDEIVVLQGLIDYKNETGVNPFDNTSEVYELLKKFISFDASKIQYTEKLRTLKRKYENIVGKSKDGDEPTFVKSHDRNVFDLSKLIWGSKGFALESAFKSNDKSKKKLDELMTANERVLGIDKFVKSLLMKSLTCFGLDEFVVQQAWDKLTGEDKKRIKEQWKVLQFREFEVYSQKSSFIHEVVTKMTETFQSNP